MCRFSDTIYYRLKTIYQLFYFFGALFLKHGNNISYFITSSPALHLLNINLPLGKNVMSARHQLLDTGESRETPCCPALTDFRVPRSK